MGQFSDFEVYQEETLEDKIVEDEVDIEILIFKPHPFLPCYKGKPFP